ncbi:MAG: hypothetical protein IAE80_22915, partial [Anaerolinea sp.]|nr:hypothetical protein [Anaerolinea sp.]
MMRVPLVVMALVLALLIAACGTSAPAPTGTPRNPPTLPAPTWTVGEAAGTPITLTNIDQLRYLGRLDAPDTIGTWFDF